MLFLGIPLLGCLLLIIFSVVGGITNGIVQRAISRNAHLQAQAMGHEMERLLNETRDQLLILAAGPMDVQDLARRLRIRSHGSENARFRELAFLGVTPENRFLLLNYGGEVINVPPEVARETRANPFQTFAVERRTGYVVVGQPLEVTYSLVPLHGVVQSLTIHVLRMTTPVHDQNGTFLGLLILSLDLSAVRDTLSLFASPRSPIATTSTPEVPGEGPPKRSMFVDPQGWVLCQSEALDKANPPLSTDAIRSGLRGDFGRPDFSIAFRPNVEHEGYWAMVTEMQNGRGSQIGLPLRMAWADERSFTGILSYAPVLFRGAPDTPAQVVGGVATLDDSAQVLRAVISLWGVYGLSLVLSLGALAVALTLLGRRMALPVNTLAFAIHEQANAENPTRLRINALPLELDKVRQEVDALLERIDTIHEDALLRQAALNAQWQRQPAQLQENLASSTVVDFVGEHPVMRELRSHIGKAALVSADVLVVGETGTGKEMASDAIHSRGGRASAPLISINCGALDENLLMDTLFGHVKGAFTEARGDRKGAFLAAEGGTLMLDEVGNASGKVQQALLRALSTRRIRPLGSDTEIPFDVRIIAATNVDLLAESRNGTFREDLYYRLAVITIKTPPLREHKSDIPLLAGSFLAHAAEELGRRPAQLSKGALDKLINYDWPGNVRELKNTLTRALTFTEGDLIFGENIVFGDAPPPTQAMMQSQGQSGQSGHAGQAGQSGQGSREKSAAQDLPADAAHPPFPPVPSVPVSAAPSLPSALTGLAGLNPRQQAALAVLRVQGSITRQEYQEAAGGDISMRTAQYDLQDMVNQGLLLKQGRGPASRYVYKESRS